MMAQFPSKAIAERSFEYRTLGIGYANIGGLLMTSGIPYDSAEGRAIAGAITAVMTGTSYLTSAEMAKELGPFADYTRNAPHMLRVMGSADIPRTGVSVGFNLQHFTGKPFVATTQVSLSQGDQRILLEPRGARRMSQQTIVDLRVSRVVSLGERVGQVELLLDVLNLLNDTAEEDLATDNLYSPNFARPTKFVDPRRVMLGFKLRLGGHRD